MFSSLSIHHLLGLTKPCAAEGCDREFVREQSQQRFCSAYCRMHPLLCVHCGENRITGKYRSTHCVNCRKYIPRVIARRVQKAAIESQEKLRTKSRVRFCKVCKRMFDPKPRSNGRIYCSKECRDYHNREQYRLHPRPHVEYSERICAAEYCDERFIPKRHDSRYCCKTHRRAPKCCVDCGTPTRRTRCNSCSSKKKWREDDGTWRDKLRESTSTREFRDKQSRISTAHWKNQEYRNKTIASLKKTLAKPESKEKRSKASKRMYETNPELRKKQSILSKKRWSDPKYRKKKSLHMKQIWNSSEHRDKVRDSVRKYWANPEHRQAARDRVNLPERKEVQRRVSRKNWMNPEYRKKMTEVNRKRTQSPKFRKAHSERTKKLWKDPAFRAKYDKGMRVFLSNPKALQQRREAAFQSYTKRGTSNAKYPPYFRSLVRPLVLDRSNWSCEYCNRAAENLDIHHIDHNTFNNVMGNLICLCKTCHNRYGNTDLGRQDSKELGPGFETIAHERTQDMPIGWHEAVNEIVDYARNWNREMYNVDLEGRGL